MKRWQTQDGEMWDVMGGDGDEMVYDENNSAWVDAGDADGHLVDDGYSDDDYDDGDYSWEDRMSGTDETADESSDTIVVEVRLAQGADVRIGIERVGNTVTIDVASASKIRTCDSADTYDDEPGEEIAF